MNNDRIRELLDAYGADARRWPADERVESERLVAGGAEAAAWIAEARALDDALDSFAVPALDVTQRVMDAIPVPPIERFLAWLVPRELRYAWRPALAATLPVLLGIAIGVTEPGPTDGYDAWAAAERDLLTTGLEGNWYE